MLVTSVIKQENVANIKERALHFDLTECFGTCLPLDAMFEEGVRGKGVKKRKKNDP